MKKAKKIAGITIIATGAVITALNVAAKIHSSYTIIAGPDGPTSVFVAGKTGGMSTTVGIVVGIVMAVAGMVLITSRNAK